MGRMVTAFLLLVCQCVGASFASSLFSLTSIPANQPVLAGQEVILTCQIKGFRTPMVYSVMFKRKDKGISEKCQAYEEQKYRLVCEPNDWRTATTYKLYIKSVTWADRGEWSCIHAANMTRLFMDVYVPASLEKMKVASLFTMPRNTEQMSSEPETDLVIAGADTSLIVSGDGQPPAQHIGLGTRTNPYDLRPGLGLQLTCETTCGYPSANISWLLLNETVSKPPPLAVKKTEIHQEECNRSLSTRFMSATVSTLNISCTRLGLIGLNEVQCNVGGPQYKDHTPSRHVYVLCPEHQQLVEQQRREEMQVRGRFRRRGERPMHLTSGEVVGIAIGAAIALIILFIGCIIVRNNNRDSPLPLTGHIPGQRV